MSRGAVPKQNAFSITRIIIIKPACIYHHLHRLHLDSPIITEVSSFANVIYSSIRTLLAILPILEPFDSLYKVLLGGQQVKVHISKMAV